MSIAAPPAGRPAASRWSGARFLAVGDIFFKGLCQAAAVLILLVAALLLAVLVERSLLAMRTFGLGFVTQSDWNPNARPPVFGSLAFVYGTVMTSAIAMLIAVPLGVGTAAYLSEIASGRLERVATFFIEMLAAIPSVIYGFWGVFVLAPLVSKLFALAGSGNVSGRGILSAALVLSVMIVPYVAAISYDVCKAVPRSQREAALAVGATRWQTIWRVVLPYARPGIVAGAFLALGRALGETMAVTMLIGNRATIENPLFGAGDSIASQIANQYTGADTELFRSVLVELALLLLLVTLVINSLARLVLRRFSRNQPILPSWLYPALEPRPAPPAPAGPSPTAPAALAPRRQPLVPQYRWLSARHTDSLMTGVLASCVGFTMSMLVVILAYLVVHGVGALNGAFFTQLPVGPTVKSGGGLANAIVGTLEVVAWATLFAVPIGLLAAIYLAEYRPGPLAHALRFVSEQLGGVPSIVMGLFAAGVFALVADALQRRAGYRPKLYGWSGVFALAVMMVPIVLRAGEEALKLVQVSLRNASYALGASHAQTVLRVTVPAALPAIVTAVFLSVARIAGETAPLLLTAGFNKFWPEGMGDFTPTLPPYIYKYATGPSENWNRQAWSAAFLLMALVLLLNFGIRLLTGRRLVQASRAD